ncbi:hypothetical protein JCM5296_002525 [Sporobolomyces johnsonii]
MFTARTTLRSAASLVARPRPAQLSVQTRFVSSSPVWAQSAGEGKGEKKDVGGSDPVSARAEGVKNAAKSFVEGAQGLAQKATGTAKGDTSDKHPGPSHKSVLGEEIERGLKEGGVKKGDEQGSI